MRAAGCSSDMTGGDSAQDARGGARSGWFGVARLAEEPHATAPGCSCCCCTREWGSAGKEPLLQRLWCCSSHEPGLELFPFMPPTQKKCPESQQCPQGKNSLTAAFRDLSLWQVILTLRWSWNLWGRWDCGCCSCWTPVLLVRLLREE